MSVMLIGRHFNNKELTLIINKMIKHEGLDSDLSDGNFSYVSQNEKHIEMFCDGPIFNQQIKNELFTTYADGYGHRAVCGNCAVFNKLSKKAASWGTCNWFASNVIRAPFWFDANTQYGSISPEQSGCDVFRLDSTL